MADPDRPVEMVFLPFVGGGHQIPMIDMARVLASHKAKSVIIATPRSAVQFQNTIRRDQISGQSISIHVLELPENAEIPDADMSAAPFTDTSILKDPLILYLSKTRPDCVVLDTFNRWASDVIDQLKIPMLVFNGNCCFSGCVGHCLNKHETHDKVGSDLEPFVVPDLPDRIVLTRSQLPVFVRRKTREMRFGSGKTEGKEFGSLVNSFYELEPDYVEFRKREMGKRVWLLGPVSLCNRNAEDKAERGQQAAIDEHSCLTWLNSKEPNSVLYISFGSLARLPPQQVREIAYGLEASNCQFIWVIGKILESAVDEEAELFPSGFVKKMEESKKGLIIKGWAPQILILEHSAVGGFLTHCGWNSTLEGVTAGVPMLTWPVSAEQFFNEKLVTDVLGIGVQIGSKEWGSWNDHRPVIGRENVEATVKRLMDGGDEAAKMRRKARELGEKAKRAVEEGGSSYRDADGLISELKSLRKN